MKNLIIVYERKDNTKGIMLNETDLDNLSFQTMGAPTLFQILPGRLLSSLKRNCML